ncbi:MAG TPA: hypothetical protein VM054_11715 [bacterium]|nr:hypothetical protein [bacterium]
MLGRAKIIFTLAAILAGCGLGCASKKPCDLTREDFDDAMFALDSGDLVTVEEVVGRLQERDPEEPLIPFFQGMLAHRRGDAEEADLLFDDFYSSAYDRYIKGFDKLSIYDRTLIQTARTAALDVMDLYIGEGRYMASNLFNILVDDLDAAAKYGGANR